MNSYRASYIDTNHENSDEDSDEMSIDENYDSASGNSSDNYDSASRDSSDDSMYYVDVYEDLESVDDAGHESGSGEDSSCSDDETEGMETDADDEQKALQRAYNIRRFALRESSDPLTHMPDSIFKKVYRLSKNQAGKLIDMIGDQMAPKNGRGISVDQRVLIVLQLFASGSFQWCISQNQNHPTVQSSVSKFLKKFLEAIEDLVPKYIKFPGSQSWRKSVAKRYHRLSNFNGILGLIDGTFIRIKRPTLNEEAFYSGAKSGHGINCQTTVEPNMLITSLKMSPGADTDQFIWNNSHLKKYMESLYMNPEVRRSEGKYYCIADSGYSSSPVILSPILKADEGSREEEFTRRLCSLRSQVERSYGLVKQVFPCCSKGKILNYEPDRAQEIIQACVFLHNFKILDGNPIEDCVDVPLYDDIQFEPVEAEMERKQYLIDNIN